MLLQYTPWHVTDNRISYFLLIIFLKDFFFNICYFCSIEYEISIHNNVYL